jgi:hypothetical protein
MLDPLGKYWNQPRRENIDLDDEIAIMSECDFNRLSEYNWSKPTGAYLGKMWKRFFDLEKDWFLFWYGNSDIEGYVRVNSRKIVIV